MCVGDRERECVCVCMCVCVGERGGGAGEEREREEGRGLGGRKERMLKVSGVINLHTNLTSQRTQTVRFKVVPQGSSEACTLS